MNKTMSQDYLRQSKEQATDEERNLILVEWKHDFVCRSGPMEMADLHVLSVYFCGRIGQAR